LTLSASHYLWISILLPEISILSNAEKPRGFHLFPKKNPAKSHLNETEKGFRVLKINPVTANLSFPIKMISFVFFLRPGR